MRIRRIRFLALSVLLGVTLSAAPAVAAPNRDDGGREVAPITKAIKQLAKFVLRALDRLIVPTP